MLSTIEKVIQDKNYNVIFDDNIVNKQGQSVNAQINDNNGEVEIKLNPNSNRAGEFLLVHEITHAIETDGMKQLVLDYASKNSEFNNSLESLKQTYGTNDVSGEVLADISGQLLGNQEYINSLSTSSPNVFKRLYNAIISLANKITGNSKESLFIKDLKNKWETAYRTQNNNLNDVKYSKQFYNNIGNVAQFDGINYITDKNAPIQKNVKNYFDTYIKGKELKNIKMDQGKKYAYPGNKQSYYKEVKAPSVTILSDIIDTMNNKKHEVDRVYNNDGSLKKHSNLDTSGGFNHYDIKIGIPNNNGNVSIYSAESITRIDKNGREYFYDLSKIKDTGQKVVDNKSKPNADSSASNEINIPQSNTNVKSDTSSTKYSMQESQNNTRELDNSSFSFEKNEKLSDRVSGDELLDAEDLINEIRDAGANINSNGYVTVYHQTTNENANKIINSGKMIANEPYVYFSTSKDASQSDGRGSVKLEFEIPAEKLILDDVFVDNADVKIKLDGNKELNVSNYLVFSNKSDNKSLKQKQNEIIQRNNKALNETSTWIRKPSDIKTFEETLQDSDYKEYYDAGEDFDETYTADMAKKALETGMLGSTSYVPACAGLLVTDYIVNSIVKKYNCKKLFFLLTCNSNNAIIDLSDNM